MNEDVRQMIQSFISEGDEIVAQRTKRRQDGTYYISGGSYRIWLEKTSRFLHVYFPDDKITKEFIELRNGPKYQDKTTYEKLKGKLLALMDFPSPVQKNNFEITKTLQNFDKFATQMSGYRKQKYEFNDEYDTQNAIHAILKLFYKDIRAEDYVPECAGGKSRVDFYIPEIETLLEVKFIRPNLRDYDVGGQLLTDIGRYEKHNGCRNLILFIFDPSRLLKNPHGLAKDLEEKSKDGMNLKVIISPIE
ncbi:hypothetical protein [Methanolapillus millepedarum]|uniref:Uncharacterized protein n=1 Tax=Methanolapillus millepedarum TaxID=3028296 RepID=A0AA96ZTW6_9EURY|nr:hypothetical protein MsAc7_05940 [Methanosarcinaceae archaeon Ac7]